MPRSKAPRSLTKMRCLPVLLASLIGTCTASAGTGEVTGHAASLSDGTAVVVPASQGHHGSISVSTSAQRVGYSISTRISHGYPFVRGSGYYSGGYRHGRYYRYRTRDGFVRDRRNRYDRYDRYDPLYMDTATLVELARRLDPQLINPNATPQTVEPAPTALELGRRAMHDGEFEAAITHYAEAADGQRREEAEETIPAELHDREAQRLLGLAYAAHGSFVTAARELRAAYREDPSLARRPLHGETVFGDERTLKRLVRRAVSNAHREKSSDAWFLVGVLMQAEGRYDRAREMMQRADAMRGTEVPEEDTPEHTDLPDPPGLANTPTLPDMLPAVASM